MNRRQCSMKKIFLSVFLLFFILGISKAQLGENALTIKEKYKGQEEVIYESITNARTASLSFKAKHISIFASILDNICVSMGYLNWELGFNEYEIANAFNSNSKNVLWATNNINFNNTLKGIGYDKIDNLPKYTWELRLRKNTKEICWIGFSEKNKDEIYAKISKEEDAQALSEATKDAFK